MNRISLIVDKTFVNTMKDVRAKCLLFDTYGLALTCEDVKERINRAFYMISHKMSADFGEEF